MRAILLIGRLCCGKSTYARRLMAEERAVLLSVDELMQTLFPDGAGEQHDLWAHRCRAYLYAKTRQLAQQGYVPVLDFGFWSRAMRQEAAQALSGLTLDWRYLDIPQSVWQERIARRNAAIETGQQGEYYVDEGLLAKCEALFEAPTLQELPDMTILRL